MFALPTVRVVNSAAPDGYAIINESDLTADHELWTDAPPANGHSAMNLRLGKGPRGKWYVWLGQERVEGPFETEADAGAALSARTSG